MAGVASFRSPCYLFPIFFRLLTFDLFCDFSFFLLTKAIKGDIRTKNIIYITRRPHSEQSEVGKPQFYYGR